METALSAQRNATCLHTIVSATQAAATDKKMHAANGLKTTVRRVSLHGDVIPRTLLQVEPGNARWEEVVRTCGEVLARDFYASDVLSLRRRKAEKC
jgi:hypothetical protein